MNSNKDHKHQINLMDSVKYHKFGGGFKRGKHKNLSISEIIFGSLLIWIVVSEFVSAMH